MPRKPLWTWSDLCTVLDPLRADTGTAPCEHPGGGSGSVIHGADIDGIEIDSRRVRGGELFIAMPAGVGGRADARDGHPWIEAAAHNGAAAVIAMHRTEAAVPQLIVRDSFEALGYLARARRDAHRGARVAVTGSAGKTTFKNLLAHALGAHSSEGSFNNDLGVPLTLARMPGDAAHGVFEIGMNAPGEIAPLARAVSPHVAVVLNVLRAHRGAFADDAALRREKLSIAAGLPPGGTLIAPDDLDLAELPPTRGTTIVRFGRSSQADVRLIDATPTGLALDVRGRRLHVGWHWPGAHRHGTVLACVAALEVLDALNDARLARLDELPLPPGRGGAERLGSRTLIDDAYNANPDSMAAALIELAARPGQRVAILGEMRELGSDSERWHRDLAAYCKSVERIVLVGEGMRPLASELARQGHDASWFPTADDVDCEQLVAESAAAAQLLVKGSNTVFWQGDFMTRLRRALASAD